MWGNQCRNMQRHDIINYLINKNSANSVDFNVRQDLNVGCKSVYPMFRMRLLALILFFVVYVHLHKQFNAISGVFFI